MNNVRICFLLSLGLHVAFLVVPFPAVKSYSYSLQPGLKDFHLPVTVDLVQESATQSLPAVSPISKPQVSVPRSPDLFLHAITQSFSILSAKKKPPKNRILLVTPM